MKIRSFTLLLVLVFGIIILINGCDGGTGMNTGNGDIGDIPGDGGNIPDAVQRMYNELKSARNGGRNVRSAARSVIGMGNISTEYNWAVLDKYINEYTAYPDHHHISTRDWTGVEEGVIKLDFHGLNGDGTEMWIFISIQNGDHYVIFAGNDNTALPFCELEVGVFEDRTNPGQKWFYKWQ